MMRKLVSKTAIDIIPLFSFGRYANRLIKTRAVRGSDYSPAIALSEEKDKLV